MNKQKQQQYILYGGAAAVAVAIIAIVVSFVTAGNVSRADVDVEAIGHSVMDDGTFVLGNPDAPITIVEFADFLCPYCQEYKSVMDRVKTELVSEGLVRYEFRTYPLQGATATYYAQLLECSGRLGGPSAYWLAYDELFIAATNRRSGDEAARNLASAINVPYAEMLECTGNANQHNENLRLGQSVQVQGTPAVRIRFNEGALQPIRDFTRAGVPFEVLRDVVMTANSG